MLYGSAKIILNVLIELQLNVESLFMYQPKFCFFYFCNQTCAHTPF